MSASPGGVEVGRVSVRVVPDTSRLGADLDLALRRIEAQTELKVNASIDNTRLDAEARAAVDQAQLAAGNIHIKAEVDTSQIREAESAFGGATSAAQGFSSGLSGIMSAVLILGPALIPLTAAVVGLAAALAAPIAIVGGGLTVFGVIAGITIAQTTKQLKSISALQTKLDGLTKGTQAYADTLAKLRGQQAALSPAQVAFQGALAKLKTAFGLIPKAIVLDPLIAGIKLLTSILPSVTPILKAVSGVVSDVVSSFDGFAKSPGFKSFVAAFASQLGADLRAFAAIAGNVFKGLFGLFGAFNQQLSGSVLSSLETLTAKFANWGQTVGQSKGFKSFVDYIKRVGPLVAKTLGDITLAVVALGAAFAPIGGVVLTAIDGLAKGIASINPDVLATLATALVGLAVGSKLLGPFTQLLGVIGLSQPEIILVVAGIAALTVGFIALYRSSKPLQQVISDLGGFFKTQLLPVIKQAASQIMPALSAAFRDISKSIKNNKPFLEEFGKLLLIFGASEVIGGIYALIAAIRVLGKVVAAQIFVWHAFADTILSMLRVLVGGFAILVSGVLQAFGTIIGAAAAAFGWIPGIGPKIKAAQANFNQFADKTVGDLKKTSAALKAIQDQIDGLHGKTITVTVIGREQGLDRATGPGGGMGRPGQNTPAPNTKAAPGGTTINVNNLNATSSSDLVRQGQKSYRQRAGGGVTMAGSNQ